MPYLFQGPVIIFWWFWGAKSSKLNMTLKILEWKNTLTNSLGGSRKILKSTVKFGTCHAHWMELSELLGVSLVGNTIKTENNLKNIARMTT